MIIYIYMYIYGASCEELPAARTRTSGVDETLAFFFSFLFSKMIYKKLSRFFITVDHGVR